MELKGGTWKTYWCVDGSLSGLLSRTTFCPTCLPHRAPHATPMRPCVQETAQSHVGSVAVLLASSIMSSVGRCSFRRPDTLRM